MRAFSVFLISATFVACTKSGDEHDNMPEPSAPIEQQIEAAPIAERFFDRAGIESDFIVSSEGSLESEVFELPGASSRASMWLHLATDANPPKLEVQAGWSNGQVGPWIALREVWAEANERVLAVSLDTAATTVRFRIDDYSNVESLWWSANVPLAASVRMTALAEATSSAAATQRSAWSAQPAQCGAALDPVIDRVVIYRVPAVGADPARYLRATQALDQRGREWCDVRANYLVEENATWTARGDRRAAYAIDGEDTGRIAIAMLGCDEAATKGREQQLRSVLSELTDRFGLSAAHQFRVGASAACPSEASDAWVRNALDDWIATGPFNPVIMPPPAPPPPPPPTPPPPPPAEATLSGRVFDASTGNANTGAAIAGAIVRCDCGRMTTSDGNGSWTLDVPPGTIAISASKMGFVDASRTLTVGAGEGVDVPLGLDPEMPPRDLVSVIDHSFLIRHFGGNDVDPMMFPETEAGFQDYLDAVGVVHFASSEYVTPNNPQVAQDCGYTILLPERAWWRKGAALGLLADVLRDLVNEPVILRNWWRPQCYNQGVGGAAGGDHPEADALDLDFRSERSRADAQRYLCDTYWKQDIVAPEDIAPGSNLDPRLNMSVGLGGVTIHLGLLSLNGRRYWLYESYTTLSGQGDCW